MNTIPIRVLAERQCKLGLDVYGPVNYHDLQGPVCEVVSVTQEHHNITNMTFKVMFTERSLEHVKPIMEQQVQKLLSDLVISGYLKQFTELLADADRRRQEAEGKAFRHKRDARCAMRLAERYRNAFQRSLGLLRLRKG